jgi:transcriptional regulator with XRE-family HTH domain
MNDDLRSARKAAGLTLRDVSAIFGLSREWLRLVENGALPISADRKVQILEVISRMRSLSSALAANAQEQLEKVKVGIGSGKPGFRTLRKRVAKTFKNPKT